MLRPFNVKFYKRIPDRYVKTLTTKFVEQCGELNPAHTGGHIIQVAIAKSRHGKMLGWCAVYKSLREYPPIDSKDYSLGIFVNPIYRHRGVGSFLRRKAVMWCFRRGLKVWWFQDGFRETLATKDDFKYVEERRPIRIVRDYDEY